MIKVVQCVALFPAPRSPMAATSHCRLLFQQLFMALECSVIPALQQRGREIEKLSTPTTTYWLSQPNDFGGSEPGSNGW